MGRTLYFIILSTSILLAFSQAKPCCKNKAEKGTTSCKFNRANIEQKSDNSAYNNENKQLIANAGAQCQHSVDYNNTAVKRNCGNCSSSPWWKFWEKKKKSCCNIKS